MRPVQPSASAGGAGAFVAACSEARWLAVLPLRDFFSRRVRRDGRVHVVSSYFSFLFVVVMFLFAGEGGRWVVVGDRNRFLESYFPAARGDTSLCRCVSSPPVSFLSPSARSSFFPSTLPPPVLPHYTHQQTSKSTHLAATLRRRQTETRYKTYSSTRDRPGICASASPHGSPAHAHALHLPQSFS